MSAVFDRIAQAIERDERAVLFTVIEGEPLGAHMLVLEDGERLGDELPADLAAQAGELIRGHTNRILELGDTRVFAEVYAPPPRLLVYGAVDTAESLAKLARQLGWQAIVADARTKFATRERIPSASEIVVAWPEETIAQVAPDHATAIVVLTHDDKFDVPALKAALETEAFYVGALGSRRNQERRRERLLEAGVEEAALDRISGPCGLDLGAESQPETAISILAEIIAVRNNRAGGKLQQSKKRIHVEVAE
ncbi:MAG TPA: XdhC/CoxI family protein [Gaiellaceae bacterium]|nr:XdhC/CoxI family protein [Gaiellaceae bacterium]